jgi:hypothetical protein
MATTRRKTARRPARAAAAAKQAGRAAPARRAPKSGAADAIRQPKGDSAEVARVLADLRTQLRKAADLYISRVDAQFLTALTRLGAAGPKESRRVKERLKGARKVRPEKGRLKDLARLEGLAEKLQDLVKG